MLVKKRFSDKAPRIPTWSRVAGTRMREKSRPLHVLSRSYARSPHEPPIG
jgi:hypothetical protein